jgi:protease I
MANRLEGLKIAFLAADGVEQAELEQPLQVLKDAGAKPQVISIKSGKIRSVNQGEEGESFPVDCVVADVSAQNFDALILPGGVASRDALRADSGAVGFVREFMELGKPAAAIADGSRLLVEANAVQGRTLTSLPDLKRDIESAGGTWVDKPVQVDQSLVTGRKPADLKAFCAKVIDVFADATQNAKVDESSEESFPASDAPAWSPSSIGPAKSTEQRGEAPR